MNAQHTHVTAYIADNTDILRKQKQIEDANRRMAKVMGKSFSRVTDVIGKDFDKMSKQFKVVDKKTGEESIRTLDSVSQKVKLLNGNMGVLTRTVTDQGKKTQKNAYSFRELSSNMSESEKISRRLAGQSSQLATNFGHVTDVNRKFGKELKNVGNVSHLINKNITKVSGNTRTFGSIVATSNGKVLQLTETLKKTPAGVQKVSRSVQDVTSKYRNMGQATQKAGAHTVSFTENMSRLAKRAIMTIPIWFAIRGSIMGVTRVMKGGTKDIVEFDKQLQRLRKNLQGTPQEIDQNFKKAEKTITDFSIKTGKSTEDITRAIQRFATVGFEYETAMTAGLDATRLSILLFGEAEGTANAFARSMRVLVSDVDNGEKSAKEISEAFALTSELYEINAFELKELNSGMEKFAGTAKSMNFSTAETITLLAALSTRGLNAERSGRLLRTTMTKMESKFKDISKVLGIKVNPEVDRTYDVFMKVINAIALLKKKSGAISPDMTEAISAMFGGVRQGEVVRDLIADIEKVNEAFKKFTKARPDVNKFRQDVEDMNDTLFRQVEIWNNLRKETSKGFMKNLLGGKEFTKTIKDGTSQLLIFKDALEIVGDNLNTLFAFNLGAPMGVVFKGIKRMADESAQINQDIVKGLRGELGREEIIEVLAKIKVGTERGIIDISPQTTDALHRQIKEQIEDKLKRSSIEADVKVQENLMGINKKDSLKFELKRQKTSEILLKNELKRMKILGASNSELLDAEIYHIKKLNLHREEDAILSKKLERERAIEQEVKNQKQILINHQLEILKMQGANNRQLLEKKGILREFYDIDTGRLEQIKDEYELQRAITKEKMEQGKVSSETLKLYKLSLKYGTGTAERALGFLRGETKYPKKDMGWDERSKLKKALDEFFPSVVEARKAFDYFAEGAGRNVPTKEKGVYPYRKPQELYRTELGQWIQRDKPIQPTITSIPLTDIKLPKIETNVGNVKIELKKILTKKDLSSEIVDSLSKALKPFVEDTIENY